LRGVRGGVRRPFQRDVLLCPVGRGAGNTVPGAGPDGRETPLLHGASRLVHLRFRAQGGARTPRGGAPAGPPGLFALSHQWPPAKSPHDLPGNPQAAAWTPLVRLVRESSSRSLLGHSVPAGSPAQRG